MNYIKTLLLTTALLTALTTASTTYACEQIADQDGKMYYVGNDCHRGAFWSGRD